jgi:hypothetical protein
MRCGRAAAPGIEATPLSKQFMRYSASRACRRHPRRRSALPGRYAVPIDDIRRRAASFTHRMI